MPYNGDINYAHEGGHPSKIYNVDIPLDTELVNTLHRRSRRQLRNIQAASPCTIKLCRLRQALQVSGCMHDINNVRDQLQGLHGPRKTVTNAVWAELMRTRTMQIEERDALMQDPPSSIAAIQVRSGCRIHIERSRCEVRLFGSEETTEVANKLLDALTPLCTEQSVPCGADSPAQQTSIMQSFGECHGVLLSKVDGKVTIFGMRNAVASAATHLQRCLAGQQEWPAPSEDQASDAESFNLSAVNGQNQFQSRLAVQASEPASNMQQRCSQRPDQPCQSAPSNCPTCGAGRFCVGCGAPVYQKYGNWQWVPNDASTSQTAATQGSCAPQASGPSMQPTRQMMDNFVQSDQMGRPLANYSSPCGQQPSSATMMPMDFPNGMRGGMQQGPPMVGSQQYPNPAISSQQKPMQSAMGYPGPCMGRDPWVGA